MTDNEKNELLIRMDVKLDELKTDFENHLQHHFKITLAAIGAMIAASVGLIVQLILRG